MAENYQVDDMAKKVKALKDTATELKRLSGGVPAVERNVDRILASIKMLEINVSDLDGIV
jgi:molybdenum cofactor biosynthesis enzyme MoaA